MRYLPQRARKHLNLAALLKVCPECLGDLVFSSDFSGDYYRCLQCNSRTDTSSRIGRLPDLSKARRVIEDAFPGTETASRKMLMG
jgi:acetyl-CoA carboxylase beta subunit